MNTKLIDKRVECLPMKRSLGGGYFFTHVASENSRDKCLDAKSIKKEKILAMTKMVNNIAHRWRQPLNTLAIMIQDLKYAKANNELTDEYIENMSACSMRVINRMSKIIDEFRLILEPAEEAFIFDVKQILQKAVHFASDSIAAQNIKICMRCRGNVMVFGYPEAFSQAILKILLNAKEALLKSSSQHRNINIYMSQKDGKCVIKISNNGPKIENERLEQIFEPYYTTKECKNGNEGLGLYSVKMLIEEIMDGKISVSSDENRTVFEITLNALPQTIG